MNVIELKHVEKTYTGSVERVTPLQDLTFSVPDGELLALMGPSGSGKSTLLHLMAGIDQPTHGEVWVGGEEISRLAPRALARWRTRSVGLVFQAYHLVPVLTAFENVEVPLLLLHLPRAERARKVEIALAAVGLSDRANHLPRQLSGGQQQRVAIARAIVADPRVLLADEPTGSLDKESADSVLHLLRRLNRELGKTTVLVTHDPRAAAIADRIVHLDKGQIVDATATQAVSGGATDA